MTGFPGALNCQSSPHWASKRLSLQFRFSYSGTVSWGSFTLWSSVQVICHSLYLPVSLSNMGAVICPGSSLSEQSKKSCYFFSLFSFLLIRIEWQLLSFLHAGQETGSPVNNFLIIIPDIQWALTTYIQIQKFKNIFFLRFLKSVFPFILSIPKKYKVSVFLSSLLSFLGLSTSLEQCSCIFLFLIFRNSLSTFPSKWFIFMEF